METGTNMLNLNDNVDLSSHNNNGIIILDGGIGGELQKLGASMDKELWAGKCTIDNPELVKNCLLYTSDAADE